MRKHFDHLHTLVGILTWIVVFMASVQQLWSSELLLQAVILQIVILLLFCACTSQALYQNHYRLAFTAFILMLLVVFLLAWEIPVNFFFIYSIIWVAWSIGYFVPRNSWLILVLITVAWYVIRRDSWGHSDPLMETLLTATFHVFALVSALSVLRSQQANLRTRELNRELLATQHLLAEASKESERTRIARDLHDLLGHHLTAMTINLQVAGRLAQGEVKHKVDHCHSLAKLILGDVRESVNTLRNAPTLDMAELLALAIREVPRLQIDLAIEEKLKVADVNLAEAILRCVQESITNTLKHSNAKCMQIKIFAENNQLQVHIHDDGRSISDVVPGNGLRGMRERIERLQGCLEYSTNAGMLIGISVPLSVYSATES